MLFKERRFPVAGLSSLLSESLSDESLELSEEEDDDEDEEEDDEEEPLELDEEPSSS